MRLIAGKYQLLHKLATGGMAEVFLAKAAGPGGFEKTLVLKFILPHLAQEPSFVEMFHSEATLAAQLSHPHIVQIFDFGQDNGAYFLAMEYVDGPSLRALIKAAAAQERVLPSTLCARLVSQACEGLAFAHDLTDPQTGLPLGLIHRDISPDNLLLTRQGTLKVVDFGIAKATGQHHKTESGVIKGKLSYMPPEQLRAHALDRRVDVYALGMVLYELLTFHKPYRSESDAGLMQTILFEPPIPATHYRPELPEALVAILARATAKEREDRYPDCSSFQSDLEEFILSVGRPMTAQQVALVIQQVVPKPPLPPPPLPEGSFVAPRDVSQVPITLNPLPKDNRTEILGSQTREAPPEPSTTRLDRVPAGGPTSSPTAPIRDPRPRRTAPAFRTSKGLSLVGAALFAVTIGLVLLRVTTVERRLDTLGSSPASTTSPLPVARAPLPQEVNEPGAQDGRGGSGDVQPPPSVAPVPPAPAAEPTRPPHPVPSATQASPRHAQAPAVGKLNVRAYPYADIFVDGEYVGTTPIAKGLVLPAGRHAVRFENSGYKPDSHWVEVKEGKSVQVTAQFEKSGS